MMSKFAALCISVMMILATPVVGHDKNDPVTDPRVQLWFDHAGSKTTPDCCAESDGVKEGGYRIPIGGFREWEIRNEDYWVYIVPPPGLESLEKWYKVPPEALVLDKKDPRASPPGFAIIWFKWSAKYMRGGSRTVLQIMCFHPGSLT